MSNVSVDQSSSVAPWHADAPGSAPSHSRQEMVIEPAALWPRVDFAELWAFRQLLLFLVWRDLKVRYAQTVLGIGWAVLQPLLSVVVFTVVFGQFAKVPSEGAPYAVFALAAVVPWNYFSNAFSTSSNSLVANSNLISKVYFPRLVVPLAPVLAGLVEYGIGLVVLAVLMAIYQVVPSAAILAIPLLLLLAMATAAGVGCWLAALNIQFRDVKHLVPFISQIWMYASPVVYPLTLVPARYRTLYALNPMVGIIEGSRVAVLGTAPLPWGILATSAVSAFVLLATGVVYFRRTERLFADIA